MGCGLQQQRPPVNPPYWSVFWCCTRSFFGPALPSSVFPWFLRAAPFFRIHPSWNTAALVKLASSHPQCRCPSLDSLQPSITSLSCFALFQSWCKYVVNFIHLVCLSRFPFGMTGLAGFSITSVVLVLDHWEKILVISFNWRTTLHRSSPLVPLFCSSMYLSLPSCSCQYNHAKALFAGFFSICA